MELQDCIRKGNLQCAFCLKGGTLSEEEKDDFVDAIMAKSQIDPEVRKAIDEMVLMEPEKDAN
jgi:hypothetical protein